MIRFLLLGGFVYWCYSQNKKLETVGGVTLNQTASPQPYNGMGQPSQKYPIYIVQSPRTDMSNQPWYGGDRSFMSGPSSDLTNSSLGSQSINGGMSLGSIWNSFSSWVGGNTQKDNLIAPAANTPTPENMGFNQPTSVTNFYQ